MEFLLTLLCSAFGAALAAGIFSLLQWRLKRKAEKGKFRIYIGKDSEITPFAEFELK